MLVKEAVGALVLSKTGRVLFNMRADDKTYPLCWSIWGGMLNVDESTKDGLLREIKEEMGFLPVFERIYPFDIFESKDKAFKYYTFVCVVGEEFLPEINHEANGYAWINLGVWPKPMHSGARKTFCSKKSEEKLRMILDYHLQGS